MNLRKIFLFSIFAFSILSTSNVEAAWSCPPWLKKLGHALAPRRWSQPAKIGDIRPHLEKMTAAQMAKLITTFAEDSFDHGLYFEDKAEKEFLINAVKAFLELSQDRARGKVIPVNIDPFDAKQILILLKRVKIERQTAEDVTIRDYLHYFVKDELYLQSGLDSLGKHVWSRPYRILGTGIKYLLIGAGLAMGWETYQAVTGSFTSSVKEMTAAEGRLQSYRRLMSGLLTYDPRRGSEGLEERRQKVKEIYVGANSTMTDPEIMGRDLMLLVDEAVAIQSSSLYDAERAGNTEEVWIILERIYFLETFFPDIWNSPLGFGSYQRIQGLFKRFDPDGELRRILASGQFQEAFSLKFHLKSKSDWWQNQDPLNQPLP